MNEHNLQPQLPAPCPNMPSQEVSGSSALGNAKPILRRHYSKDSALEV